MKGLYDKKYGYFLVISCPRRETNILLGVDIRGILFLCFFYRLIKKAK